MMKEISMHILDIVQNSICANANFVKIFVEEDIKNNLFKLEVIDNGSGMDAETLKMVRNPFYTSRSVETRHHKKVGLGIPLLDQTCTQCDGKLEIESETESELETEGKQNQCTKITATMEYNHIDRPPIGDIAKTIYLTTIMNEDIDFIYIHKKDSKEFAIDTKEIKKVLGDISLKEQEVMMWIKSNIESGILEMNQITERKWK